MEKIFKKSLALMVSAALCLTAFVGCLTVNAEATATPTYTITAQNGKAGDTVEVKVDGTNLTSVCGQQVFINIPAALKINSVKNELGVDYKLPNEAAGEVGEYNISTSGDVQQVKFVDIINFPPTGELGAIETGEFHIVFSLTIPDTAAVGDKYTIGFDEETMFADYLETEITIDVAAATITVQAAVAEPVLDENITATLGAGLSETVYMSFRINKSLLSSYSDFYLKVDRQTKDSNWNLVDAEPFYINKSDLGGDYLKETSTDDSGYYYFYYRGAELYSLSVPISAVLYCKDADGNVIAYSNTFSSTLTDLLKSLYANAKKNNRTAMATAITDTLVAGNEAVLYFTSSKQDSDYAKLESPIANFDTSDATQELGELNAVNVPYDGTGDASVTLGAGVSASPFINLYLSNLPDGSDINSYSVEFSYPTVTENKTSVTNGVDMLPSADNSRYYSYLRTLPIYSSNADVTIKVYKDGNQLGTAHYSFEQFVSLKKDDSRMGAVVTALGKLGQSFRIMKGM